MARKDETALAPLWMERLERMGFWRDMMEVTGRRMPTWAELEMEAEAARRDAARQGDSWPANAWLRHARLLEAVGLERVAVPRTADVRRLRCFLALPSILAILESLHRLSADKVIPIGSVVATTAHEMFHLLRWRHFGRRVYVLEPETFDLLARTPLPGVAFRHVRPPLPTFYVRFPADAFRFDVRGDPAAQPAEGVMVSLDGLGPEAAGPVEFSYIVAGQSPRDPSDDNLAFASALIRPDTAISGVEVPNAIQAVRAGAYEVGAMVPRMVVALCLFLASDHPLLEAVAPPPPPDPARAKSRRKRLKLERKASRLSTLSYVRVGIRQQAVAEGTGQPLRQQVWVRPHWRHQAHGPRHTLRKWILIDEHVRGAGLGEAELTRRHVVPPARPGEGRGGRD